MLQRRRSLRISRGQSDTAAAEGGSPSSSAAIWPGALEFLSRLPRARVVATRLAAKLTRQKEGMSDSTEALGRKRKRGGVPDSVEEKGAAEGEMEGALTTANNINRPQTRTGQTQAGTAPKRLRIVDFHAKVGVKRSRRLSRPPVAPPAPGLSAVPARGSGGLLGSQKSDVTHQGCDTGESLDHLVDCVSPGNDENAPPPVDDKDDEPAALGEVWLTHSQERSIQHAGEARRRRKSEAAMCPPSSESSPDSISHEGKPLGRRAPVGAKGSTFVEDQKGREGETSLLGQQNPSKVVQRTGVDPVESVIDLCSDTDDSSGVESTGLGVKACEEGNIRGGKEKATNIINNCPPRDLEPFLPFGGLRRQEARLPRQPYVKTAAGRGARSKFTAATRQLVIDWAMLRQRRLKLGDDVFHLAVDLADALLARVGPDKFLNSANNQTPAAAKACAEGHADFPASCLPSIWKPHPSKKTTYQLETPIFPVKLCRLILSCLFVAAKLIGRQDTRPSAKDFVAAEGGSLYQGSGIKKLVAAELSLAILLKHELHRPNAVSFAGAFLCALNGGIPAKSQSDHTLQVVTYFLDVALLSHSSLHMSASKMAASAVWLACMPTLVSKQDGVATFEATTGFSVEELHPCIRHLSSLYADAQRQPHLYVHRKHFGLDQYIREKRLLSLE